MPSPPRSEPILKIPLRPSKAYRTYLIALHLLALTALVVADLPWPAIAAGLAAVALDLVGEYRRNRAVEVLIRGEHWTVRYIQGPDFLGRLAAIDAQTHWFVSVRLAQSNSRRGLLIARDACSVDAYRRLRRHLTTHHVHKSVEDRDPQP